LKFFSTNRKVLFNLNDVKPIGSAFSLDGKHLATAGEGKFIHLWELPSGKKFEAALGLWDNFSVAKGQDILIRLWPRVVAAVKDARLCFVGGGSQIGRLRDLAASSPAGGSIDLLGFLPEHQMEELWPKATALALLGRLEGFGLVVIEAMRHGVPVLASTNDAASEINLHGVTGYNVDRANDEAIVEHLVGMLRNRDKAQTMGAAGRARWHVHFRFSVFRERFLAAIGPWLDA